MFVRGLHRDPAMFAWSERSKDLSSPFGAQFAFQAPDTPLSSLMAPVWQARMRAHAERYERLGSLVQSMREHLAAAAHSALALRPPMGPRAAESSGLPAVAASDGGFAQHAVLRGASAIALAPGTPATTATLTTQAVALNTTTATPDTAAVLTTGSVALNTSMRTTATVTGTALKLPPGHKTADFGSISINGVTTTLGVFTGTDSTLAAQFVVDRLNANAQNTVVASVKSGTSQVVLAAKTPGSAGSVRIDQVQADSDGTASNDQAVGFTAGTSATGVDGSTDFGSVTLNGVTTSFGLLSNTGQTAQSAAQWFVDKLNANAANTFLATVGGTNRDQLVLTSKQVGIASRLSVDAVTSNSDGNAANDGQSGFVAGTSAQGTAGSAGETDFGSVTINGVTTQFGRLGNLGQTTQSAAQFLVDRLNANAANTVLASVGGANGDQIVLTAKTAGSAGNFSIQAASSDSDGSGRNDGINGFVVGAKGTGADPVAGPTDFGSVTINGIMTSFGVLDGSRYTPQSAAEYLADRLNQTNSTLAARAEDGYLLLTSKASGGSATLSIDALVADSDGNAANDRSLGFSLGSVQGTDAVPAPPVATPVRGQGSAAGSAPRGLDASRVKDFMSQASAFADSADTYFKALSDEAPNLPRGVAVFGALLRSHLRAEEPTLSTLGMKLEGDRLTLDPEALQRSLETDPGSVGRAFEQLRGVLDLPTGSQASALEGMRARTLASAKDGAIASQVTSALYRIQQRAEGLSTMLDTMRRAQERMTEQQARLAKQEDQQRQATSEPRDGRPESGSTPDPYPWLQAHATEGLWETTERSA